MAKKNKKIDDAVDELISDVNIDRELLLDFTKSLISEYKGESAVAIAENVAKLFDSMTRQNHVRAAALKSMSKIDTEEKDDLDGISASIGMPFQSDETVGN